MKKHIILLALAAAAFAACEKPTPYEPGAPMDLNGPNVYFSNDNANDLLLPSSINSFEVQICREDDSETVSVPLIASCGVEGAFVVPETITFESGVDTVAFTVTTGENFEMFREYQITLSVPEEYTHAYKPQEVSPSMMITVLQEDFVPFANGMYLCSFCQYAAGWGAWEQVLEYSAITDTYRFSDLWQPGTFMTFQWNRETNEVIVPEGTGFPIGLNAGYGLISAFPLEGEYDAESQTLVIYVDMYDSSSWGDPFPQIYQITEFLQ